MIPVSDLRKSQHIIS